MKPARVRSLTIRILMRLMGDLVLFSSETHSAYDQVACFAFCMTSFLLKKFKALEQTEAEFRPQNQKREIPKITNRYNTKRTYGQPSEQLSKKVATFTQQRKPKKMI